jgi:mono/diheme cytochrome c family protein
MSQTCVRLFRIGVLVLVGAVAISASAARPSAEPLDVGQGQQPAASAVTFTKDIAPIFQRSCLQCHQPDSIGPMSLKTYADVRPWARSIKNKVVLGEMPPYRYDRNVGIQELKDDLRLSEKEIQTIARWVDNGAPQGNPADMPPPVTFANPNEWAFEKQFGPPDLIVKTKPFTTSCWESSLRC